MSKHTIAISVLADTKPFSKAMKGIGGIAKGVAVGAGAIAAAVGVIGIKAIGAASDLEQAMGGMQAVFKGAAGEMATLATNAAQSVGLTTSEYASLATVLGSQLKNMGVSTDDLAGQTDSLVGLGADLAAQFGGSTADAVGALSSLMRGERDPIEKYGVSINEARIQAKLAEMGLSGLTGEALTQAKTQATLALLYGQTADAQGAFARESNTLAGQQQRLGASLANISATIGTALLPAATAAVGAFGQIVQVVSNSAGFAAFTQGLANVSQGMADAVAGFMAGDGLDFTSIATGLLSARDGIVDAALNALGGILDAATEIVPLVIQSTASLIERVVGFLSANAPMLLAGAVALFTGLLSAVATILPPLITSLATMLPGIVTALLGMLPAILAAATQMFTALVQAIPVVIPVLLSTLVTLIPALVAAILGMIPAILDGAISLFAAIVEAIPVIIPLVITALLGLIPTLVSTVLGMIPTLLESAFKLFTALATAIPKIIPELIPALLGLLPTIISTLLGMIPSLLRAGADLIGGLVKGLWQAASSVGSALLDIAKSAIGDFLSFLGIQSPSRLFAGYGQNVIAGLARGLGKARPVDLAMRSLARTVDTSFAPTMTLGADRVTSSARPVRTAAQMPNVVHLSPQDRELLRTNNVQLRIGNRDIAQAQGSANFVTKRQGVG
ncbi:phage tail protein [Microbacterium sp. A94]|uniref:phage tail protein n=1 Tax=Microbacterium sp. A94 TaxID=3450717 RepID=UPI003F41F4D5